MTPEAVPHKVTIYALYAPDEPKHLHYVGQTSVPQQRLMAHISEAQRAREYQTAHTRRLKWLAALLVQGQSRARNSGRL